MKTYTVTGSITLNYCFEIEAGCIASAGAEANERASNALHSNDCYYLTEASQEQYSIVFTGKPISRPFEPKSGLDPCDFREEEDAEGVESIEENKEE